MRKVERPTLSSDHVGNLNDGINLGLGKDAFATGALDIERQDPQRSNLAPLAFSGVREQSVVRAIDLELGG